MIVLVTGATGFLGRRVVRELLKRGDQVRCLVRTPGKERVFYHRDVDVRYGNVREPASLEEAFYDVETVIHLAGIIRTQNSESFDAVHRVGTINVLSAAKSVGASHFLHVSAIGSSNDENYPYFYSKWLAEREVIDSGIPYTIFRPSILYGEGDEFLNSVAGLVRLFPMVPIIGSGNNRMQPLLADDLAWCISTTLGREDLKGRTLELGGPERLNYNELVSVIANAMGKRRLRAHLPTCLVYLVAKVAQRLLHRAPITTDQIKMLGVRNVANLGEVERFFGFTPSFIEGNIDFVNSVRFMDGFHMLLGKIPHRTRDR